MFFFKIIFLKKGSYGAAPRTVFDAKSRYIEEMELNDDLWFRYTVEPALKSTRELIAQYINADTADDIVFIENASDGYNAVSKSFTWAKGDIVLQTSISYAMVKQTNLFLS